MKAFITGVTGQDGSYLAEQLLALNYDVVGLVRRVSKPNVANITHLLKNPKFHVECGDVLDANCMQRIICSNEFDEIYNLACQSHVGASYQCPSYTFDSVFKGCLNILETIRTHAPYVKFLQAGSSEQFGTCINKKGFQDENTNFHPVSPYAVAKTAAFQLTRCYRESYGLFASNSICFNHESPRRGLEFVTRKITHYIGQLKRKQTHTKLSLGNLSASRDWGYAPEYTEGMRKILNHTAPGDYVLATGETHTVKELVKMAFKLINLDWSEHVVISEIEKRPHEVPILKGNSEKAYNDLNWRARTRFESLIEIMLNYDLQHETR